MECSPRYVTAREKRAKPHVDNGGWRFVLIREFTSKFARLETLRRRPWIQRLLFPPSDRWNGEERRGYSQQNSNG